MKVACIIPSRYASTRLPGKPLADICGKPMIQRVYEQALLAKRVDAVFVATDDERVFETMQKIGGQVILTSSAHKTGTDRLAEVAMKHGEYDIIINVQGDEPLIDPEIIDLLAKAMLADSNLPMATVSSPLAESEYDDPAAVKVVTNTQENALYFSRSLIPYPRGGFGTNGPRKHVGIYAYTRKFLLEFARMAPTPLETAESLEQLRVLENGYTIKVIPTDKSFVGVDTPEDLSRVIEVIKQREQLI